MRGIFEKAKSVNELDPIQNQLQNAIADYQRQIKSVKTELAKDVKELSRWENLMLDSLEGTCIFTPEQVKKRMDTVQASIDELTQKMEMLQSKIEQSREQAEQFKMQHQQLLSWAEIFDSATVEEKKMISSFPDAGFYGIII